MIAALVLAALALATPVDAALLAGLPVHKATLDAHGQVSACSGPLLSDVAEKAGLQQGKALHGSALSNGVVVRASDGYAALFSLAEIDPGTGNDGAIVATSCDGRELGDDVGPYHLVVPTDKRPARAVRNVVSIEPAP